MAVYAMLHYRFLRDDRYVPRDKDLLDALDELCPELGARPRFLQGDGLTGAPGVGYRDRSPHH
jgi:hypothetical protein